MTDSDIPGDGLIGNGEFLHPQDAFVVCMQHDGWKHECEGGTHCYFTIPDEVVDIEATMTALFLSDEVELKLVYEMPCATDCLPHLAVVIMRLNCRSTGKFFYAEAFGHLVWEYTLLTHNVPGITIEQAQGMVVMGWSEFENHLAELATAALHTLPQLKDKAEPELYSASHSIGASFNRPN